MTAYGPPPSGGAPPPPGEYGPGPGNYGPPPGGSGPQPGYGAPQGPARRGFDPKSVNPLDWAIMGGAVLALIFSFFSFYEYKPKGAQSTRVCHNLNLVPPSARSEVADVCDGVDNSAWHGFFGWFGVLLLLVAAVLVAIAIFAPQVRLPFPVRLASLGVAGLGFVSVLIALFVIPDGDYNGRRIPVNASDTDAGHGFSYWIVLILAAAVAGLCLMRFLQSGEGRGPASGTPQQGYAGPAPGYPPQQQGGYQPEQQQGYAAPPPAGYSAPPPPPPAPPGDAPPPAPH